jgi:hypothetical protein
VLSPDTSGDAQKLSFFASLDCEYSAFSLHFLQGNLLGDDR